MDLTFLRPVYEVPGPVVSVHLDTSRKDQDADTRIQVEWRNLRQQLERQGADSQTLDVIEAQVGGAPEVVGPQGESLFAAGGHLLGAYTLAAPPSRNRAVLGPIADAVDTALDYDRQLPHVVVAIDRQGGDIDAYEAGTLDAARSRTYSGSTFHITRVKAGGPSKASYHRRTENVWSANAAGVADEIVAAIEAVDAAVVFVGGDDKATAALREQPALQRADVILVDVSGGRGGGDAQESLRRSVDEALTTVSRRAHEDAFAHYEQSAASGEAVSSIPAVAEALTAGRVHTLMLSAQFPPGLVKWSAASEPLVVASAREALGDKAHEAFEMNAAALLLRAAVLSDADFTEIPGGHDVADGTAALLRF
ncbi:baeRF2 domain-containing protein [Streptomyces sp. Midd1]|uniref:baeRF2 domain-containing protein n=1 Tax=Streptomyces sp. Midd3 TaxID=3161191 RepID=UPI0034DB624D